ncbi:hypothetical protein [Aliirhizobium smilacinae]|uniref:hypothetical protein n=1 Tax=Aliirhizobium smilacinae TaxID=1395944 RepID=UPI0015D65E23|nr:hypothetical protein [Rhizobium smilacinae]
MNLAPPIPKYTLEELQQIYELSIQQSNQILDKFKGEKHSIDKFLRRCNRRGG